MIDYDFLIVGAGMFGAICARELTDNGKKCLVIDKRKHIGGNCYTENVNGINVHKYGAHIFHTNDKLIWEYINRFADFNNYINSPIAIYQNEVYNLPFNMNTFNKLWGVISPKEALKVLDEQTYKYKDHTPGNLEEQALKLVGDDIYYKLIRGYTIKQWGRDPKELPAFIIKRLPVRLNYDNNYFNDKYQGIPNGGYTQIFDRLLSGIDTRLGVDFNSDRNYFHSIAKKIIYTGPIDEYFDYKFGILEYRSLEFVNRELEETNFQGNAVVNYTDDTVKYTRIIEHKHFEFNKKENYTIITEEYPKEWNVNNIPYYPINNDINKSIFKKYQKIGESQLNVYFGGRLAEYQYYDMHQIIASALKLSKVLKNDN
jgi:UDP-galactopyranose mutase